MLDRKAIIRSASYSILLSLLLALSGCDSSSTGPGKGDVSLSAQLQNLVVSYKIPGAVGIVVNDSSIVDIQAFGVRRSGADEKVTQEDLFHLGSIGKSMTATMIAKLVDDGVLSWESKPADFIPDLADSIDPGYNDITLVDLLRHRAGTPADDDLPYVPTFTGTLRQQRVQGARWVLTKPPAVSPGTFHYSNAGYVIAAAMAEAATGQDWRELMDLLLFDPLGIDAFYGWPTEHGPDQPSGHEPAGYGYQPVEPSIEPQNIRFIEPAGFISMSISDLAEFMELHVDASRGNPRLLTQAAFDVLHTPVGDYGCGLAIVNTSDGTLYWHDGSNDYFFAMMYMLPDRNVGVAIAVNAGGEKAERQTQVAATAVLKSLID